MPRAPSTPPPRARPRPRARPTAPPHSAQRVRPYVVGAVLRNLRLDHTKYNSFLDLQDKLHFNICRRRTLASVGTHDLDTVKGPFTYDARAPQDIRFVPLMQNREFAANELLDHYRDPQNVEGKHLQPYTDIIYDSPVYPVRRRPRSSPCMAAPLLSVVCSPLAAPCPGGWGARRACARHDDVPPDMRERRRRPDPRCAAPPMDSTRPAATRRRLLRRTACRIATCEDGMGGAMATAAPEAALHARSRSFRPAGARRGGP